MSDLKLARIDQRIEDTEYLQMLLWSTHPGVSNKVVHNRITTQISDDLKDLKALREQRLKTLRVFQATAEAAAKIRTRKSCPNCKRKFVEVVEVYNSVRIRHQGASDCLVDVKQKEVATK